MRGENGCNSCRRRLVVEQHIAAAVHLKVDETRREPGPFRQILDGDFIGNIAASHNGGDARIPDENGAVLMHCRSIEHDVGGNSKRLARHRVRVTFLRWRGLSASNPRSFAKRTAAA